MHKMTKNTIISQFWYYYARQNVHSIIIAIIIQIQHIGLFLQQNTLYIVVDII